MIHTFTPTLVNEMYRSARENRYRQKDFRDQESARQS